MMKRIHFKINLTSILMPLLFAPAVPWVLKHLLRSKRIHNWTPEVKEPVSPSEVKTSACAKWQKIQCGETSILKKLPIIVKAPDEEEATVAYANGKFTSGDFEYEILKWRKGYAICWKLKDGEHLYGVGERYFSFDLRGEKQTLYAMDAMLSNATKRMYKPVPFLMSSAGYGIFVHSASTMQFDATGGQCTIVVKGPLEIWRVTGTPKEILSAYTELTGRAPVPPKWSFGLWISRCMYPDRETVEEIVTRFRDENIPVDVASLDPLWLDGKFLYLRDAINFKWNTRRFPNPPEFIQWLKERHVRLCLWINPYIPLLLKIYNEAKEKNLLVTRNGRTCLTIDGPAAILDLSRDEAAAWYKEKLAPLLRDGVEVFKTDYGEGAPDTGDYKNYPSLFMHNLYPYLYNEAVFDVTEKIRGKGIVFARSAWAGSQRFPVHWSGDTRCTWEQMRHCLIGGLNFAMSGFAHWSHDIGGFVGVPSPELFIRWAQFGLFVSHARTHGTTPREPWLFGNEALQIFKKYTQLRYRFIPYLYSYAHAANKTGAPILRPTVMEYPCERGAALADAQYLLGADMLVAPVLENGARKKKVYFPKGEWVDWHTQKIYTGPGWQTVDAALDALPLFARRDAIIPLGPEIQYVDEKTEPLTLFIFNPENGNFTLHDDNEEITFASRKENNEIVLTISPCKKSFVAQFYGVKGSGVKSENAKIDSSVQTENFYSVSFATIAVDKNAVVRVKV